MASSDNAKGKLCAVLSLSFPVLLIVLSLGYAFLFYPSHKQEYNHCLLSAGIIAFWTLIPPMWFWYDWRFHFKKEDAQYKTHLHDLGRNIWLALVAVLAYAFGIKPLGGP